MKRLLCLLISLGAWLPLGTAAETALDEFPVARGAGIIDAVDFAASSMIVSGYRYHVLIDATVEIGGTHGAFTMLRPGMRIRFDYRHVSGTERRVFLIQEVPANVQIEET